MLSRFFNVIILMGALQGLIVSSLLLFPRKQNLANKLLAFFIFFIALACLNLCLAGQKWTVLGGIMPLIIAVVPMVVIMPLGPLLFFYIKAVLQPNFKLGKKDKLHFATVIIDLVPYLTALFFIVFVLSGVLKNQHYNVGLFIDDYNVYSDIPRWLSLTVYLFLSIRHVVAFKKSTPVQRNPSQLKWLRQLIIALAAFQTIWLVYLVPYVMPVYGNKLLDTVYWYPIYVPMSILIYWLGIKGYLAAQAQPETLKNSYKQPHPQQENIIMQLRQAMEVDKLYLNPNLNLDVLARHTAIPQKTISAVLNQYQQQSFNEFVNRYRVDAFKHKIISDEVKHLTIAGIAAKCGFNSPATFQRTFKQLTGLSPSEFKIQALKGS